MQPNMTKLDSEHRYTKTGLVLSFGKNIVIDNKGEQDNTILMLSGSGSYSHIYSASDTAL